MSTTPARYDTAIQRRVVYDMVLQFQDDESNDINLTGWTVSSEIWDQGRTTRYAIFTVAYTDRAKGKVTLSLTAEQTTTLPDKCYYDVLLTDPSSKKEYYLEGIFYVAQGYTE